MMQVYESLVSIIIPCYNMERWVSEAITSALDQTYPNIEVIVVDDGSTDDSLEVIKKFDGKVRWTTGPNQGPCAARNLGVQLAQGDWIQFLDADDVLHPHKVDLSLKSYEMHPYVDFIWAPHKVIGGDSSVISETESDLDLKITLSENVLEAPYAPWAAMFPKEFLLRVGHWNESLTRWVDLEYHARIAATARTYIRISKPLYFYRQHDGERISNANRNHTNIEQALKSLTLTRANLEASNISAGEWRSVIFPFYIQLSRSAAIAGDAGRFCDLLREAGILRGDMAFHLKCYLARACVRLFGIRWTSVLIEGALRLRNVKSER